MAGACVAVSMLRGAGHPVLLGSTLAAALVALGGALATFARSMPRRWPASCSDQDAAGRLGTHARVPAGKMRLDPTPGQSRRAASRP